MYSRKPRYKKSYKRKSYIPRNRFKSSSYYTKLVRKPATDIIKYPINDQSLKQFSSYIEANISYFPYLQRVSEIVTAMSVSGILANDEVNINFFDPDEEISIFHNYPQFEKAIVVLESIEFFCNENPTIPLSYVRYSPFIGQNISNEDFSVPGLKFCLETALEDSMYNFIPIEARPYVSLDLSGDTVSLKIQDNKYVFDFADEYNIHTYFAEGNDPNAWPSPQEFKRIFPYSFISRGVDQHSSYNKDVIPGYLHELYTFLCKTKNFYNQFQDPSHPHLYVPLGIKVFGHPELEMRTTLTINDQSFYIVFEKQKGYYNVMSAFPAVANIKAHWSVYLNPDLTMNADNSFFIRNAP